MEECCVVCAEPLEWVGYGVCGHRDVCSKCIVRLRFVLNDRQCCICKQECPSVFITKALGDYTKAIDNFDTLRRRQDLLYDDGIQAYFDDEEHFQMIKAMCRLSCTICENSESSGKDSVKKGFVFRNLDLLRRHIMYAHKVQMCGLCLEGRKVFICEQKLYSKQQIDRHLSHGDPEIDGNDEERGGFTGHPLCSFCRKRFYGDNELFQHMSTEHYTCHICQRLRPGNYDYYRNYDDLEAHFRHEHALCEHPDCLAQKFVVFSSHSELKRHNALVHGGNMSRAQRNAALQIPVSFQYRRPGQDRRGNWPSGHQDGYSNESVSSVSAPADVGPTPTRDYRAEGASVALSSNPSTQFPALEAATSDVPSPLDLTPESPPRNEPVAARYRAAVSGSGSSSLQVSAFPPLPGAENAQQVPRQRPPVAAKISMASLLTVGEDASSCSSIKQAAFKTPERNPRATPPPALLGNQAFPALVRQRPDGAGATPSPLVVGNQVRPLLGRPRHDGAGAMQPPTGNTEVPVLNTQRPDVSGTRPSPTLFGNHEFPVLGRQREVSAGAMPPTTPDIHEFPLLGKPRSDGVVVTASDERGEIVKAMPEAYGSGAANGVFLVDASELRMANKALIESIRLRLKGNQQSFDAFKRVSAQFRTGEINSKVYFEYIEDLGLVSLVPELARLCPDLKKQEELLKVYEIKQEKVVASSGKDELQGNSHMGNGLRGDVDAGVEVLSKDGYRDLKGKKPIHTSSSFGDLVLKDGSNNLKDGSSNMDMPFKILVNAGKSLEFESAIPQQPWACQRCTFENKEGSSSCLVCGASHSIDDPGQGRKPKKKGSKFRLGDGSAALVLNSGKKAWKQTDL